MEDDMQTLRESLTLRGYYMWTVYLQGRIMSGKYFRPNGPALHALQNMNFVTLRYRRVDTSITIS